MDSTIAAIRTSDRSNFKRCRRKWGFQSALRHNRTPAEPAGYFWIGTGGHYALEDFHGHNIYRHPCTAFEAYIEAQRKYAAKSRQELPSDWEEQAELGMGILSYYMQWLDGREPLETYYVDGQPQVEITCRIEIPVDPAILLKSEYDRVEYQATFDRIVIDKETNQLYVLDYKFYKQFMHMHLDMDQQFTAYLWAADTLYDLPIAGGILHQFKKVIPKAARVLKNGDVSADKNQATTHRIYRQALIDVYGSVDRASVQQTNLLNRLAHKEGEDRDDFIWREKTYRNEQQLRAEGTKILMEAEDMLNPDLPLYPNPTKDCSWDCPMSDICIMMDRDDDWEGQLMEDTIDRKEDTDSWRNYLPHVGDVPSFGRASTGESVKIDEDFQIEI